MTDSLQPNPVDDALFRNVVGHFATGVTVITTADGDRLYGTTASAVSSLSMEPPMMLICLNRTSTTHDAVVRSGVYGISILSAEQGHLAKQFARKGDDKFAGADYRLSGPGIPVLNNALATIICKVQETVIGGTHTVFLGRVIAAEAHQGEPLAYYRGTFGRIEPEQQRIAYEQTREWVLQRRTPLGECLEAADIAAALSLDPVLVQTALITLVAEALVTRRDDGTLVPTPITPDFIDNLFNARMAIETGVIESALDRISDADLADLRRLTALITATTSVSAEQLDEFLRLNLEYHLRLVGIAESRQLSESYLRLNVTTIWRETFDAEDWTEQLGNDLLSNIFAAVERKDVEAAKEALKAQTTHLRDGAKRIVAARGGVV